MKTLKIFLTISILNFLALIAFTFKLPEIIPVHFNLYGVADNFAIRWTAPLFGLIPLIIIIAMMIYRHCTKNIKKYKKNQRAENIVFYSLSIFLLALSWMPPLAALSTQNGVASISFPIIILIPLGILMIILGNIMSIIKPNRYFGARTPWTLKNDRVWQKTHRKDAYVTIFSGIILIIGSIISHFTQKPIIALLTLLISVTILIAFPFIYSYWLYKKLTND